MSLSLGVMQRPADGETVCGDSYAVVVDGPRTTIAVADGLGHGEPAAEAARAFCACVEEHAHDDLQDILRTSHRQLSSTRGAAVALVRVDRDASTLEFVGVGNVELRAARRAALAPISMAGVVGHRLRGIRPFSYQLVAGDFVVLFTDGVSSRFEIAEYSGLAPQVAAETILGAHGKSFDDATCLVFRY